MFLSGCNIAAQKQAQSPSANHLLGESSSYLLEHVNDPVDWYPWGKEALAKARQEDKPIFLSIGYSSCHWCHVMHRECFQNAELARLLNENFVCIKVDREQRPDLDDTYMQVTEAMTGRGGWPMTLLLTAELKPFFAATYLPPSLLKALIIKTKDDWRNNRTNLNKLADDAVVYLHAADEVDGSRRLERSQISTNIDKALSAADPVYGGIGMEHKFPPPALISLLMAHSNISGPASREENLRRLRSLRFSYRTLDAMALMGLHDYLGGGFYRYCVDRRWSTPHFEKMLYTNALLAQSYLDGFLLSGKPYWADTARSTLDFCLRDLGAADGFYCSLDADSDGKEGLTYLFTRAEIYKLLAGKDAEWFCRNFNVSETGNFKGRNILYLERDPESLARQEGLTYFQWAARAKALGDKLLAARAKRPQPRRDEKILVGWNGLMISSLVQGYKVLGDEKYLLAARKTAAFLLSKIKSGALPHDCCAAADSGFLDDYAFTVQGLLDLGLVDPVLGDSAGAGSYPGAHPDWLAAAKKLNAETIERFYDSKNGDFYLVAGNQEQVLRRARIFADEVLPSANAVAIKNNIRLGLAGDKELIERAGRSLASLQSVPQLAAYPQNYAASLGALNLYLNTPVQIRLVCREPGAAGDSPVSIDRDMRAILFGRYLPGAEVQINYGSTDPKAKLPAVYICRDQVCEPPITQVSRLKERLSESTLYRQK